MGAAATNVDASVPRKAFKAKKNNSANVFKAALLTLFGRRKAAKRIQADVAVIVGCMRPLNLLQDKQDADHAPREEAENLNSRDDREEDHVLVNKDVNDKLVEDIISNHEDDVVMTTTKLLLLPSPDHIIIAPMSPSSSSECGGDSRYASALNLHELDKEESCDDDENENEEFDDTQGDAMIDMKAEMFIAQFYAQMKIQNSA